MFRERYIKLVREACTKMIQERPAEWIRDKLDDPSCTKSWDALCLLCERSYWTRSWIIQELAASSINSLYWQATTCIFCGQRNVELHSLFLLCQQITLVPFKDLVHYETGLRFFNSSSQILRITNAWSDFRGGGVELLVNLCVSGTFETSEPRDIVYSLLGIARPYHDSELKVDYTVSTSEVFKRTAKYIILGSKNLEILLYCSKREDASLDLPSWVPDWAHFDYSQ